MFAGLLPLYLQNKYFQLVTELFIKRNWTYQVNAPSSGHLACFDECWVWIAHLLLRPLENMEGDHNLPFVLEIFHLKLCSRDLSFESLTLEIFHWSFRNFLWGFVHWRFFLWRFIHWRFFLEKLRFFFEELSWRFIL